jgi:DNA invertase Pin-like site-specific DNA recombinase
LFDTGLPVVMENFRALRISERNSLRTKEALAAKRMQGVVLGKPKGTIQKSKFDKDEDRIKELLKLGLSVRKIAKLLGYTNHLALNTYVNKRGLRLPRNP